MVLMDKPIQHGVSVLDRANVPMYDWHYGYMKPKYGDNVELDYTDTDSFIYEIRTDDYDLTSESIIMLYYQFSPKNA